MRIVITECENGFYQARFEERRWWRWRLLQELKMPSFPELASRLVQSYAQYIRAQYGDRLKRADRRRLGRAVARMVS